MVRLVRLNTSRFGDPVLEDVGIYDPTKEEVSKAAIEAIESGEAFDEEPAPVDPYDPSTGDTVEEIDLDTE